MDIGYIILIAVCGAVVLIGLIVAISVVLWKRHKKRKVIAERKTDIKKKLTYYDSLRVEDPTTRSNYLKQVRENSAFSADSIPGVIHEETAEPTTFTGGKETRPQEERSSVQCRHKNGYTTDSIKRNRLSDLNSVYLDVDKALESAMINGKDTLRVFMDARLLPAAESDDNILEAGVNKPNGVHKPNGSVPEQTSNSGSKKAGVVDPTDLGGGSVNDQGSNISKAVDPTSLGGRSSLPLTLYVSDKTGEDVTQTTL